MGKYILILLSLISLQSCKNENNEIEKLKEENEALKKQIIEKTVNNPKFVWTVITYKIGRIEGDANGQRLTDIKTQSSWTEIEEIPNFDYTTKLRMEDEFESKLRQRHSMFLHSIVKRETYDFNTYAEASEFKFKAINQ